MDRIKIRQTITQLRETADDLEAMLGGALEQTIDAQVWYKRQIRPEIAKALGCEPNYLSSVMSGRVTPGRRFRSALERLIKDDTGCETVIMPDPEKYVGRGRQDSFEPELAAV